MAPALCVLFWADYRAQRLKVQTIASSTYTGRIPASEAKGWFQLCTEFLLKIDAIGLIILGFSWSLIFLPFTLETSADNGFKNRALVFGQCFTRYGF